MLPLAMAGSGLVVCTECPWRLRHEYPEHAGFVCRNHIERFDAAPAAVIISGWMKAHGFRDEALSWVPARWVVGTLSVVRSKLR